MITSIAVLVLLALAAIYVGTIEAAFSALMRLSLRLMAERNGRAGGLGPYLDDPVLLFVPVRLLMGLIVAVATVFWASLLGVDQRAGPRDHRALDGRVRDRVRAPPPSAHRAERPGGRARFPAPVVRPDCAHAAADHAGAGRLDRHAAAGAAVRRCPGAEASDDEEDEEVAHTFLEAGEHEGLIEREDRALLQSIVDFGDTLVREVMTPRPDIVAIRSDATLGELRALLAEQEYPRIPVFQESLDHILGFVYVKDLIRVGDTSLDEHVVSRLLRPAHFVPETKRVAELLKDFQRQQVQSAIVVDEYGGTAGLVTIEDLLEEIVGEIRDEYDVESESIVDEGKGVFVFSGKVDIDDLAECLDIEIEREGFETVGGFILSQVGRVPAVGDVFEVNGLHIEVLEAERRRVNKVRVRKLEGAPVARGNHEERA